SFYVCHGVAGYVLMLTLLRSGLSPAVAILVTACAMLLVSSLLFLFVERPTRRFGQRLAARLGDRARQIQPSSSSKLIVRNNIGTSHLGASPAEPRAARAE